MSGALKSRLFYKIKIWNLYRLNHLFGSFITHDIVIGEDQSKKTEGIAFGAIS